MDIAKKWIITDLDSYPESDGHQNVVYNVHWSRVATYGSYVSTVYGVKNILFNLNGSFIPYNNLTEEQVINWLESSIDIDKISEIDSELDKKISEQINPSSLTLQLPWI